MADFFSRHNPALGVMFNVASPRSTGDDGFTAPATEAAVTKKHTLNLKPASSWAAGLRPGWA